MFMRWSKFILWISLALLVTSCGQANAVAMVQPTQTPGSPVKEEVPIEIPEVDPPPTEIPTKEPIPTEIPTAEPEPELPNDTWKVKFGGFGNDTLQKVILSKDGGYLILGSTNLQYSKG